MAFTVDTPLINATRRQNVLIAGASDVDVRDMLEQVISDARGRLITATDSSGQHLFYTDLTALADPSSQTAAEILLDGVLDAPVIRGTFSQAVSQLAAARLVEATASILTPEQSWARAAEKRAYDSLDRLIKSPTLKNVAAAIRLREQNTVKAAYLFMSLAPNTAAVDVLNKRIAPFAGAQEAGTAIVSVDGALVSVPVAVGDTPVKILQAIAAQAAALSQAGMINVNFGVNENAKGDQGYPWSYTDPLSGELKTEMFAVNTNIPSLEVFPRDYDGTRDLSMVQLYLVHPDPVDPTINAPGIQGLLISDISAYSQMTENGPYAVAVDLQQGRTVSSATVKETTPPSDMLFFQVSGYATPQTARATVTFTGDTSLGETVTVTVAGVDYTYATQPTDTPDLVAAALLALIAGDADALVTATATGGVLELTAKTAGAGGNAVTLAVTVVPVDTTSNLIADPSGVTLTGGANPRTTRADGDLIYRVENRVSAPAGGTFTVPIPAGSDALAVVSLLAQHLAENSQATGILGAIRPSTKLTINGTDMSVPGIEFLAYSFDAAQARIVLTVTAVPGDVVFAVVSPQLVPTSPVDAREKSVVLTTFQFRGTLRPNDTGNTSVSGAGAVHVAAPKLSSRLQDVFKRTGGSFQ